jgi:hypothetical protein
MKYLTIIVCLWYSSAMGQIPDKTSKSLSIGDFQAGKVYQLQNGKYEIVGHSTPAIMDTVAVWMLTTLKVIGDSPVTPMVLQQKGYSVTPRIPDNYIVWMSTPRKEDCPCKP